MNPLRELRNETVLVLKNQHRDESHPPAPAV
jgi:hypothetical protein